MLDCHFRSYAVLTDYRFCSGSTDFSVPPFGNFAHSPAGKPLGPTSSFGFGFSGCHVTPYRLHKFGSRPFRVSAMNPAAINSFFALFKVDSEFHPFGCMIFQAADRSPLFLPENRLPMSTSSFTPPAESALNFGQFRSAAGSNRNPPA